MAVRSDVSVDFSVSPRVLLVASPSVEISAQDLHDTCRWIEALPTSMDDPSLVDSSGYEVLDATTKVGLTVTLDNALVAFAARPGPEYIQCSISGGNVVAVDASGNPFKTPVSPTAFTQVVTTASSSATSTSQSLLENGLFQGTVCIDSVNGFSGTGKTLDGLLIGTRKAPALYLSDAIVVADRESIIDLTLIKGLNITTEDLSSGYKIRSDSLSNVLTVAESANVSNCLLSNVTLSGYLDGLNSIESSVLGDVFNVSGYIKESGFTGKVILNGDLNVTQSYSHIQGLGFAEFDISSFNVIVRDFHGSFAATNITGGTHSIGLEEGRLILDSLCTGGTAYARGVPYEISNSSTGTVLIDQTNSKFIKDILDAVTFIRGIEGGSWELIANQMIFKDESGVEISRFNMFDKSGALTTDGDIYKRVKA